MLDQRNSLGSTDRSHVHLVTEPGLVKDRALFPSVRACLSLRIIHASIVAGSDFRTASGLRRHAESRAE